MGESTTLATGEFVAIASLRERAGVARSTLRRRLKRRGVPVFLDPSDERARLVRRQDAEALLRPRPAPGRAPASATDEAQAAACRGRIDKARGGQTPGSIGTLAVERRPLPYSGGGIVPTAASAGGGPPARKDANR